MKCGVGVVLKFNPSNVFNLKVGCGRETNARGNLFTILCLLFFARSKQIINLQILGDSKVSSFYTMFQKVVQVPIIILFSDKISIFQSVIMR